MKEIIDNQINISFSFMLKYYLHRVWRITPPYMCVLMFNACLSRYLSTGPFYPLNGFETNFCSNSWWTNLLYLNNLVNVQPFSLTGIFMIPVILKIRIFQVKNGCFFINTYF